MGEDRKPLKNSGNRTEVYSSKKRMLKEFLVCHTLQLAKFGITRTPTVLQRLLSLCKSFSSENGLAM